MICNQIWKYLNIPENPKTVSHTKHYINLFVIVLILFLLLVYLILQCNRLALTLANIVKDNEEVIVWLEKYLSYL